MGKWVGKILPHLLIILALFLGTLWVLDQLNPLMDFLDNEIVSSVLFVFIVLALGNGIADVYKQD